MKLIGVAMVSNEADVIETFVRFNLRLLDALVVLNHRSLDETEPILAALAGEGLPLTVLRDADPAFRQGERMTMMARRYLGELSADFCFALDADEFVVAASRDDLEQALSSLPEGHAGLIPLRNYVPNKADWPADEPLMRRLAWRLRDEGANSKKVVLPERFGAEEGHQVSLGNHAAVHVSGSGNVAPWPHARIERAFLAHYPVRSPDQIAKKALLGWLGTRLWRPERFARPGQSTPATHWRALFERIAAGHPIDFELMEMAIALYAGAAAIRPEDLVLDPIDARIETRHSGSSIPGALPTLARWADQLVDAINRKADR